MGCCSCIFGCVKGGIDCVAKTVLMALNGFFAAQGLTITVVATIALIAMDALGLGTTTGFLVSVLVFGATILITSVLGCCGACFKNKCMLIVYIILLVGLIIGQIVLVSMAGGIRDDTKNEWREQLVEYDPANGNSSIVINTDTYQRDNECCGIDSIDDWRSNQHLNTTESHSLPNSCCIDPSSGFCHGYFDNPDPTKIYTEGCYEALGLWGEIVWGVMISIIIIQGVLVVLAACLSCKGPGGDD